MSVIWALAASACALPPGWAAVEARRPRYVIFGETHGTAEAPALVAQVACALVKRRERVLVAIEQQAADDAALQRAWRLPHRRFAAALLDVPGWRGRQDGVASVAMFGLLVRLHALGSRLDVVRFNGTRDEAQRLRWAALPGQGPHEAAQAENIRDAAARRRYDRVLILTGSLHARRQRIEMGQRSFDPMARQLAPVAEVMSLRLVGGAGTVWNCLLQPGYTFVRGQPLPPEAMRCGSTTVRGVASMGAAPSVALGDPPGAEAGGNYDGYVWIGQVNASPPVLP